MNLSPAQQKALLQFVKAMLITAIIAALSALIPLIDGAGSINWRRAALAFALAFAYSAGHSIATYLSASNEADLGTVIEAVISALEKRYQTAPLQGSQMPQIDDSTTGHADISKSVPGPTVASASGKAGQSDSGTQDTAPRPIVGPPGQ